MSQLALWFCLSHCILTPVLDCRHDVILNYVLTACIL